MKERTIDRQYLQDNRDHIFVFGDNTERKGSGGAAVLRDEPNTYGFITKKRPDNDADSYYTHIEYFKVYKEELHKLIEEIKANPDKTYLISRIGGGIANKHNIWEYVIEPTIHVLSVCDNVEFLWEEEEPAA